MTEEQYEMQKLSRAQSTVNGSTQQSYNSGLNQVFIEIGNVSMPPPPATIEHIYEEPVQRWKKPRTIHSRPVANRKVIEEARPPTPCARLQEVDRLRDDDHLLNRSVSQTNINSDFETENIPKPRSVNIPICPFANPELCLLHQRLAGPTWGWYLNRIITSIIFIIFFIVVTAIIINFWEFDAQLIPAELLYAGLIAPVITLILIKICEF